MSNIDSQQLPPLPTPDTPAARTCAVIRLYLAVEDDLSSDQAWVVTRHVRSCASCAQEQQMVRRSARLVHSLPDSQPSARVDQAVMAAIAARARNTDKVRALSAFPSSSARTGALAARSRSAMRSRRRFTGIVAAAAALVLTLLTSLYFVFNGNPFSPHTVAFQLPTSLSWDKYVLYCTETRTEKNGTSYQIQTYHHMTKDVTNVQYLVPGEMDVVVVKDGQGKQSLGMDVMHRIAQKDVDQWDLVDLSEFELTALRTELQNGTATFEGQSSFQGQEVYRVRNSKGEVLLLNMDYMPINVLKQDKPIFDTLRWLPPSQVSSSLWNMEVPSDFTMGSLPTPP
jgi:hypothetical protein